MEKENQLISDIKEQFNSLMNARSLAVSNDKRILEFLLENSNFKAEYKERFFEEQCGALIFKKDDFLNFLDLKLLSHSYTSFSNKIGLGTSEKRFLKNSENVVLNYPYKDCVLKGGQSRDEDKSTELFFNNILAKSEIDVLFAPKVLNNFELLGEGNINEVLENKPNLLIKGNNLIALHTLKEYFRNAPQENKVKLIYIDPPYNTGNDSFNYNDKFNHSTWLCFMKNRLEIARELLRDDGVIFVQCDDNEQAYLKVLMDEIFGRENFESCITHIVKPEGRMYGNIAKTHEYILVYAKNLLNVEFEEIEKEDFKFSFNDELGGFNTKNLENGNFRAFNAHNRPNLRYPLYIDETKQDKDGFFEIFTEKKYGLTEIMPTSSNGFDYVWRWGKEKCQNEIQNLCAKKTDNKFIVFQKTRKTTTRVKSIFWEKEIITKKGTDEIKLLFSDDNNLFSTPKPEFLIKRILEISTNENDLVLDFFAGSGTTLAVAHKMKRKYIGIEQMGYIQDKTKERLKKVIEGEQGGISKAVEWKGGGNLVYCELASLNASFIEKIENSSDEKELNEIYESLRKIAFIDYRADIQDILKDLEFSALSFDDKKRILKKCLDRNMDYIPYADMEDSEYKIDEQTRILNKIFYKKS